MISHQSSASNGTEHLKCNHMMTLGFKGLAHITKLVRSVWSHCEL